MQLFYGSGASASLCDFGGALDCSSVNGSEWSHVGPVPIALVATPTYALMALLGWRAARRGRESDELALLFGLGALTVAYSLFLAAISTFVLQAFCLVCVAMYLVNLVVTGLAAIGSQTSLPALSSRCLRALSRPGRPVLEGAATFAAVCVGVGAGYATIRGAAIAESTVAALGESEPAEAAIAAPIPTEAKAPPTADKRHVRVPEGRAEVVVPRDAATTGPADAPVTLVAFLDFQCPFCKRLAGTLHLLQDEYPEQLRIAYLQFPMNQECNAAELKRSLHPEACRSARAAVCAGRQGQFVEAHDLLFQESWRLGDELYASMPGRLGLDGGRFGACMSDPSSLEAVIAESAIGEGLDVNGTPQMFVNGRPLAGAQPIEVLRAVIDAELANTDGLLELEVEVGTERIGVVTGAKPTVTVRSGARPFTIDAFEASFDGSKAVSRPGVPVAQGVSWYQAQAACEAAGKRLCTGEEWLTACMGSAPIDKNGNGLLHDDPPSGRFYAYGGLWQPGTCADSRHPDEPGELVAGNHPGCATPDGIYDLHGNVKEWVGLAPGEAAVVGGSYFSEESARCTYHRADAVTDAADPTVGFRCCEGPVDAPDTSRWPGGKVGDRLQPFTVDRLDGGTIDSASLRGKAVILTFWASWCGPCREEMPILSKLQQTYAAQGLQVLAISIDEKPEAARRFLAQHPMSFEIGIDPRSELRARFQSDAVPTTFWVRRDGTIALRTVGVPPGGERRLDELTQEILREPAR